MDRSLLLTLTTYTAALLLAYLAFTIISPLLAVLVWAGAIGTITFPIYRRLLQRLRGRELPAAALMTSAVVLAFIIPLIGVIFTLSREVAQTYQYLDEVTGGFSTLSMGAVLEHPALAPLVGWIQPVLQRLGLDLEPLLMPALKNGLAAMLNYSTDIVKNFFAFFFKLTLMVITLFFVYRDGPRILQRFWEITGVAQKLVETITDTMTRVLGAVMYGIILTCMVQGTLGGLGFWATGLPSPFLFGTIMAICAPIPFVGTALVWGPGALYLLFQGKTMAGILLMAWGVLAVGSIDNVIRPLFISGRAKLPILLIVFGVLGGLLSFGLSGVLIGPMILALALVVLDNYRDNSSVSSDIDQ